MKQSLMVMIFLVLACISTSLAQIPHTISYQGLLTDGAGTVVPDGIYIRLP